MAEKKYYWLKLKETYFDNPKIKMLRKIAGGDTFTIIYLKMQLMSIRDEGILKYEGIDTDFANEIALKIDEDVENVKVVLSYLEKQSLIDFNENQNEMILYEASQSIGSECESAERVRAFRERQKMLQCNESETAGLISNISISKSNSISSIFEYWKTISNNPNLKLIDRRSKAIEKALNIYSEQEIKDCIDRYWQALRDERFFFNYEWDIDTFLTRQKGISAFTEDGEKWKNYQKEIAKKGATNANNMGNNSGSTSEVFIGDGMF